jgi:hypothetical protein
MHMRDCSGDDSLRLVHPLESYRIDLGQPDDRGTQQVILTLDTDGGFSVSFALTADTLARLARSIFNDVIPNLEATD